MFWHFYRYNCKYHYEWQSSPLFIVLDLLVLLTKRGKETFLYFNKCLASK